MTITVNWTRRLISGHWQANVTGSDGEGRLLKFPPTKAPPPDKELEAVQQAIEDAQTERDAVAKAEQAALDKAAAADKARVHELQKRGAEYRDGKLDDASKQALLDALVAEVFGETKGKPPQPDPKPEDPPPDTPPLPRVIPAKTGLHPSRPLLP